ncbi:hypothetical protein BXP70_19205 [Hymenobacter crusticola]|uniref:STAS domain-containing protein n=2 Tax=Hymenobacter crusticola TaxID=1770526 RepID=A0A243WA11_9BACT|nr:hypothetical protein BXP70_19205 [Hymenobacter crusticola]
MLNDSTTAALTPVVLASLNAKQLAELLVAPLPQLLIDCGELGIPHPLGVCHFVSQLLCLRRRGTRVWLCNVPLVLHHSLSQLGLGTLFPVVGNDNRPLLPDLGPAAISSSLAMSA